MTQRRQASRPAVFLLAGLLAATAPVETTPRTTGSDGPTHRFDIAAGPLDAAVDQFVATTGARVLVANGAGLQGLVSPGVAGVFTLAQALGHLLSGTGLTARLTAAQTFTLDVEGPSEVVDVVGEFSYRAAMAESATRTTVPLLDVPQAITVVPRTAIVDQSMQSLGDVLRYVPGVGTAQGEGNRDTAVFRGTASTADFFVDGLRDDVQYYRDLYNVERVEILKGPNAMMFGRGGAGGVINRSTRQADWSRVREVVAQAGSYANRRVTADVGDRLGNASAVRAIAMYEHSDTYRDDVSLERYGVNPTFAAALGAGTLVRAGYEYFHDGRTADRGVPSWGGLPYPASPSAFFGDPEQSRSRASVHAASLTLDHRIAANATLKNRTRVASYDKFYQNVYAAGPVSADGSVVPIAAYNNATDRQNTFSQTDVVVTGATGAVRHVILAGIEVGRQETANFRETGYFAGGATTLRVPVSQANVRVPVTFRQGASDADNAGVAWALAAYGQDHVELSSHLDAIVGLRVDRFEVDVRDRRTGNRVASTDVPVSPRAGLVYKPVEPVSVYASYSLAYVPRAGEQLASLTLSTRSLEPEQFRNYEVGAKWDVRPSLGATVALYRLDRRNVAVPDPLDPARLLLVDGQRARGLELGVSGRLARAWQVTGAYAHQDGELVHTLSPTARAGATLAQLPRHTFSLWNRYDLSSTWAGGVGIIYRDEMYASTDNAVTLPSFVRVDAALYCRLSSRVRAQLNVENLLDARYSATAHNNVNITPGSPRAARVTVTTGF